MKKLIKNIHRGKWSLVLIPVIMISLISLALFGYRKIFASMTYKLITDSNGIRWQYGFDPSNNKLEVSFFDTTNSITQITIPDKSYFINNDSSISSVSNYIFTNYADHDLGTPSTFSSTVTKIDLSKANEVNGVAPLLKTDTVTEVVFNTTASKIGKDAFRNAKLNAKNMNKITDIGHGAFYNVTFSTTTISMPNLTSLGNGSFEGSNITTVELNSPVIGVSAFKNCTSLTTATFKDNVNELSAGAFMGDTALSSVTFNKVKIIGSEAFKNCTSFNQDIKNTQIESIGAEAFAGTTGLTKSITIPSAVEILPFKVFAGSNIESVDINNVYWIGTQAFEDCHLDEIDLKQVERIDYRAFANNNIEELYLPKSIVYLAECEMFLNNPTKKVTVAFDTMSNKIVGLSVLFDRYNVLVPLEEVELIAPYASNERAQLNTTHFSAEREYYINDTNTYLYPGSGATSFYDTDKVNMRNRDLEKAMSYKNVIQGSYLCSCKNVNTIIIGDGYEFIGVASMQTYGYGDAYPKWGNGSDRKGFYNDVSDHKIEKVVLPETLKGVGMNAFEGQFLRESVEINLPESIEYLGPGSFAGNLGIDQDIYLPNLKHMGNCAFYGTGITGITFNDKLEYIGNHVILESYFLKKIILDCDYFGLITPEFEYTNQTMDSRTNSFRNTVNYDRFDNLNEYLYGDKIDLIKFTEKVVTKPYIPVGWENWYNSLFYKIHAGVIDLEDVTWTSMTGRDFIYARVDTLKLPKNLTKINESMFYGATINNPMKLPDSIRVIERNGFMGANVVFESLPSQLEIIGIGAFIDCPMGDDVVIPNSVKSIGKVAFGACSSIGKVCHNYIFSRIDGDEYINRKKFTFNKKITPTMTNGEPFEAMFFFSSLDELVLEEGVTETPTMTMNGSAPPSSAPYSEFSSYVSSGYYTSNGVRHDYYYDYTFNAKKVTIKGLSKIPAKAFINNQNIKIVDLSEDANLTEIEGYAFYNTPNLEKVILPAGKEIIIGEHAFHESGIDSIGDETSGLDVKNTDIILDGECTFQAMPDLVNINLTEHFNEGVIPNGTFADCPSLNKVELQSGVTTIEPYAFYHDSVIDSFVMYGDTEIKEANYIELRGVSGFPINLDPNLEAEDFTIEINDTVKGKTTYTKSNFSNNASGYNAGDRAVVRLNCSDNIALYKLNNTITVYDRSSVQTIPPTSNLYCYSTNELCQNHYDTYKTEHDNEDTKLYYLDEVIYMDSNGAPVELNADNTELVTDDLVLYALRRDGVVIVSKKWKQKTGATKLTDSGITIRDYDSTTEDPSLMIFNNRAAIDSIDTDNNDNFENIEYVVGDVDPNTERVSISLVYNNIVSEVTADTTLRTQGNAADITYSDGCGGAAFANVIFRDVAIGTTTPSFGENPTRDGYDFLGWDKEISETVAGDVIYTARWNRVGDPIPEPPEPVNPWSNIVNPQTGILLIILLPIIVLVLGSINIYLKKKREA